MRKVWNNTVNIKGKQGLARKRQETTVHSLKRNEKMRVNDESEYSIDISDEAACKKYSCILFHKLPDVG